MPYKDRLKLIHQILISKRLLTLFLNHDASISFDEFHLEHCHVRYFYGN